MSAELAGFLAEGELDRLDAARQAIGEPSGEDAAAIGRTLREWTDVQAVANLLMHPDLIDEELRVPSLRRGLAEQGHPYLALAAAVGLQRVELDPDERAAFAELLLERMARESEGPLAGRASVTLASLLGADEADQAVGLLDHPDDTVRHNVLVALIGVTGAEGIGPFVAAAEARGAVSEAGGTFADLELAALERRRGDGPLEEIDVVSSGLGAPLLTYIPNLEDC